MTVLAVAVLCLALLVPELDATGEGTFCYDLSKRALWSIECAYSVGRCFDCASDHRNPSLARVLPFPLQ